MDISFSKVSEASQDVFEEKPKPLGVIMLADSSGGAWEIRRSDGLSLSGSGAVSGLKPGTSWINNLRFEDSRGVFSQREYQQLVRSGSWLGFEISDILAEWGYSDLSLDKSASFMATICGRISDISFDLCCARDRRTASKSTREIYRGSSLATSLLTLYEKDILLSHPSNRVTEDHFTQSFQNGISWVGTKPSDDDLKIEFLFPRVSYAIAVADCPIPAPGDWQMGAIPEGADPDRFVSAVLDKYGDTTLFRVVFDLNHDMDPSWLIAMTGNRGGAERTRFTGSEMRAFGHFPKKVSMAMYPEGGSLKTATSGMLQNIIDSFGGGEAARMSWSLGLFSENALKSSYRSGRSKDASVRSGEAVWLAAQDRILTYPLVQALSDAGANIMRARNGRVLVSLPRAVENVMAAAYAAWEVGAHLPLGDAIKVKSSLDITLPDEKAGWPGDEVDFMVASLCHAGSKRELWGLDGLCKLDAQGRMATAKNIMSSWTAR